MKRSLFSFLLFVVCAMITLVGCSKPTIHGKVVDFNGNPLPGIVVSVVGADLTAESQNDGSFELPFSVGDVKLTPVIPDAPDWIVLPVKKAKLSEDKNPDGWDVGELKLNGSPIDIGNGKMGWTSPEGYIDNIDGTISDPKNKLMWEKQRSQKQMLHREALEYAKKVGTAGYKDWRVPTMNELSRLPSYKDSGFKAMDLSDQPTILSSSTHNQPHPSGIGVLEKILVEVLGTGRVGSAVRYMNATRIADRDKGYVICVRNLE